MPNLSLNGAVLVLQSPAANRFGEIEIGNSRKSKFQKFPVGQNSIISKQQKWFRSIGRDRTTFRRRTFKPRSKLVGGSHATARLSLRGSLSLPVVLLLTLGKPARPRVFSRGEPQRAEGQGHHARDAGEAREKSAPYSHATRGNVDVELEVAGG